MFRRLKPFHSEKISFLVVTGLTLLGLSQNRAQASESNLILTESNDNHRFQVVANLSSLSVSRASTSISGSEFGLGVEYAFQPKYAIGISYHQGFTSLGVASIYSAFQLGVIYAITGNFSKETRKIQLGDSELYSDSYGDVGGLRAALSFSQYFFNGTGSIFPYSGIGAALYYEFNWLRPIGLRLGVRGDYTGNGNASLRVMQGLVQLVFPL